MKKVKEFFGNFKQYLDYLMTVNFKELFVNVLILFCIIVLSFFVYIPVGVVQELIRSFIVVYATFSDLALQLFNWLFLLISTILAIMLFGYLFNKRFSDIEEFKKQVKDSLKSDKNDDKKDSKIKEVNKDNKEEFELPKKKKN